jgi:tetratricopeptide (TPR) repeat protein
MSSLLDLFSVLDGWGERKIGEPVLLQPDPALAGARKAIASGVGMRDALVELGKQIDIARPALRGLIFDVVESSKGNSSPEILRQMLCDLHMSTARIRMRQKHWNGARAHLLRAAACESGSNVPELTFVEVYVETGAYRSAVTALENALKGQKNAAFSLFELATDLADRGARDDSRLCLSHVINADEIGTIQKLAERRLADITGNIPSPSDTSLQELCEIGVHAMQQGKLTEALDSLLRVLSVRPREGRVWFFVGYMFCVGTSDPPTFRERATTPIRIADVSLSEERYQELLRAEEELTLACGLAPSLIESWVQLASCHLLLGRRDAVLDSAAHVFREAPDQAEPYALLSQILLGIGELAGAAKAAMEALKLEPENVLASRTIATLESALEMRERK